MTLNRDAFSLGFTLNSSQFIHNNLSHFVLYSLIVVFNLLL